MVAPLAAAAIPTLSGGAGGIDLSSSSSLDVGDFTSGDLAFGGLTLGGDSKGASIGALPLIAVAVAAAVFLYKRK